MRCRHCGSTEVKMLYGKDHKRVVAKTIIHKLGCIKNMKGGLDLWLFGN